MRFLAGRATEDSRAMVSVRTLKPTYEVNRKVTVQLVRQRRPGADLTGARFAVDVTDPKGRPVQGLEPRVDSGDPDVASVELKPDDTMAVTLVDEVHDGSFIAELLLKNGFRLKMLKEEEIDLEDVFLGITKGITN